jgi:hypothetical protein
MKHARVSDAWRPVRAHGGKPSPQGVVGAFVFNVCLLVLPIACALAVIVVGRDHLYAYEYSEAGARVIGNRVETLNASLIQLDFDRHHQWDDLIAMELMASDIPAARGFLLSGGEMLPARYAGPIRRAASRGDAAMEQAALEVLTPGTRARYESMVPLLSRRASTTSTQTLAPGIAAPIGDERDFELMARAIIAEPETDSLQFILTGFGLGLAGDFDTRAANGATALLTASRRPDYPAGFGTEMYNLLIQAMPVEAFRAAALASATDADEAGAYANAAAAFRASINPTRATQVREALQQIGAMGEATSVPSSVDLVTHATALRDLPRLRLLAQAAGDRSAAAAKRLPRDGRLLGAARGDLTITRQLAMILAIAGLALFGLIAIVGLKAYQTGRRIWMRMRDDEYGSELVDMGGAGNWRPL